MSGGGYKAFQNEEDATDAAQDVNTLNVQFAGSIPPAGAYPGHPAAGFNHIPVQGEIPPSSAGYVAANPINQQPGFTGPPGAPGAYRVPVMMPAPQKIPGCPPGLEYLAQLDQVLVHQQIELAEVFLNMEFQNKYVIKNSVGQQVYFAREESELCMRLFCGSKRGFVFHITDNLGQEVIRVVREFKCFAGCCWCANGDSHCSLFVAVESPPGNVIGYVRQTQSWISPRFDVLTADKECALKIQAHWCRCQGICCTDDIDFNVLTNDLQNQVGKVSKQWGGWVREAFTKADNFGVQFPTDLDVKIKATLLAATFLIDFMFFEKQNRNRRR